MRYIHCSETANLILKWSFLFDPTFVNIDHIKGNPVIQQSALSESDQSKLNYNDIFYFLIRVYSVLKYAYDTRY